MTERFKTTADYVVVALSPLLIFLMISSLANFLMLIFYRGGQPARVSWTVMMFTLGTVGIARVAIEKDRTYSLGYAVVLGLATFLVITRLVTSPIASIVLLVAIAYLSDWVVRDCTLIDENADSSDQGLIDSGRLWVRQSIDASSANSTEEANSEQSSLDQEASNQHASGRSPTTRPKSVKGGQPGQSVFFLALAALPLYGLGQFFIRSDANTWAQAQKLLAFYLFSALALLVTTSFLGLRRYLRQRGADMPREVTVGWIAGGLVVIVLILGVAYLVPVPGRLIASFEPPAFLESPGDLVASKMGWGDEGADKKGEEAAQTRKDSTEQRDQKEVGSVAPEKGAAQGNVNQGEKKQGKPGQQNGGSQSGGKSDEKGDRQADDSQQKPAGQPNQEQDSSQQPPPNQSSSDQKSAAQKSPEQNSPSDPPPSSKQDNPGQDPEGKSSDGETQASQSSSEQASSQSPSQDSEPSPQDSSEDRRPDDSSPDASDQTSENPPPPSDADSSPPSEDAQAAEPSETQEENEAPNQTTQENENVDGNESTAQQDTDSPASSSESSNPLESLAESLPGFTSLFKALIFLGLVAVVGVYVWINRNFLLEAWRRLFERNVAESEPSFEAFLKEAQRAPPKPFSSYQKPDSSHEDPRRMIVITFSAFDAWCREAGMPRDKGETPSEFLRRVAVSFPELASHSVRVIDSYNRVVYGRGRPDDDDLRSAERVWKLLRQPRPAKSSPVEASV